MLLVFVSPIMRRSVAINYCDYLALSRSPGYLDRCLGPLGIECLPRTQDHPVISVFGVLNGGRNIRPSSWLTYTQV